MIKHRADSIQKLFQSTPSARRATWYHWKQFMGEVISIHALREEGDVRDIRCSYRIDAISIHALREEGDVLGRWWIRSW